MTMRLTDFGDIDGSLWSVAINPDIEVGKIEVKKIEQDAPKISQETIDDWVSSNEVYIPGMGWVICLDDSPWSIGESTESYLDNPVDLWQSEVDLGEANQFELHESELPEGYVLDNEDREAIIKTLAHISSPTQVLQEATAQMLNVLTIMLIVVSSSLIIVTGLKYAIIGVSKNTNNYDKSAYRQSVDMINQFSSYKYFQRSMKWWVWRNREKYATEINNLFIAIAKSPYKDDLHYQYEVIQLFPKRNKLKRLLKDDNLKQLIDEIDRLTETYWVIDF